MMLDMPAIALFFASGALLLAALFFFTFREVRASYLRLWTGSLLVLAAAWGLVSLRGIAPGWVASALAFSLLSLHYAMGLAALGRFYGVRQCLHWPYWPALIAASALAWFSGDPAGSRVAAGAVLSLQLAMTAALLFTRQDRWTGLRFMMAGASLGGALFIMVGVAVALDGQQGSAGVLVANGAQGILLLLGFLLRMVFAFGFMSLVEGRRYEEVHHLAFRDSLTGAYNRRSLFEFARRELLRHRRTQEPLTLLMFDLDHFKRVNDTRGHLVGDRVLREVKAVAEGVLRGTDVLTRYGGEEFCVLAPNTPASGAAALAERLRQAVAGNLLRLDDGSRLSLTISVGVATLEVETPCANLESLLLHFGFRHGAEAGDAEVEELLAKADAALYAAKAAGRDQAVLGPAAAPERRSTESSIIPTPALGVEPDLTGVGASAV